MNALSSLIKPMQRVYKKLSIAIPDNQLRLIEIPPEYQINNNAIARNAYGCMAQELVCAALGIVPIPINGNYDICFDACLHNHYYEIKSCRHTGKVVVYDWRINKELKSGVDYSYAILVHRVKLSDGKTLLQNMIEHGLEILLIDGKTIAYLSTKEPLRKLISNTKSGYNRKGYVDGYRNIPIKNIRAQLNSQKQISFFYAGRNIELTLWENMKKSGQEEKDMNLKKL